METGAVLKILKERNNDLSTRLQRLQKLDSKIDASIENLQKLYEVLLQSQEAKCAEMVEFDEEIKEINKKLFPSHSTNKNIVRKKDENQKLLVAQINHVLSLDDTESVKYLINGDPTLNILSTDVETINAFIKKYESFLL
ncbi:hypothetical protein TVAG_322530 [Trichomonas vaginalis G3]|uniref:Uncharacterized protein n=1 Tax=Trichomonas vaginalis (strain ATCC PRA-98 / G3) TaxID=412133 RepID=A2EL05_TRIV3|nr:hypothetical protein TVAGG3_0234740 [Trichomonas vaginalis G3]EAY06633.1 hypothetical protein TVAG_322530 [Trichomonas vaginalis G3]KAI5552908.1 hypothetical protein TVAGG3_0234740 [Trichomonas vaginalis G3]|eukprot:XP_001318856.1 hypothetical protein [Trichomonas vaginalis G3]